ncbi:MAG: hypothetical protein IPJ58_07280 [Ardenticatenia bacterium]|nr:hypothetical protein [Ardenticatenia bacterium]
MTRAALAMKPTDPMAVPLAKLLAGISALTLDERRQHRDAIDKTLDPATREREVELALLNAGLLSALPPGPDRGSAYRECELIAVSGGLLSETIVEECR